MTGSDRPGREVPKDYREVVLYQVDQHGWRYDSGSGRGGHPVLYPADRSNRPIPVPTTPSDQRGWRNFVSRVRRAGGIWPPDRR